MYWDRGKLLILACLVSIAHGVALLCDRTPEGANAPKSRVDNRYRIEISGNPETYSPGEMYTVSLKGSKLGQVMAKFVSFSLSVESGRGTPGMLNHFGDSLTKFSDSCPNTIVSTNQSPKPEVQVLWTAPPATTGCVTFRATVVEAKDIWYQDDGLLSKTLCEDLQQSRDEQPEVNQKCCACDEAKYEITFEGLWSRHTHPKDFPTNWVTRFSDVIGASHTTEYRFWDYGGIASEGLKQVAERGSTRMLESELKSQSQHIRTIIKARGISFPNVTGKTFAVFRVDSKHHLISLVSMIDPSPDWIVGVSGLELCLSNCSWLENKVLNLYPWDAGTDSGITYTAPDMPTEPRDNIRRITSTFPADQRSPFYDPSGEEMKPLARLYLTRQRLYEKSCLESNLEYNSNEACEVGEWSEWSPCSASCGAGKRTRQRNYKNPQRAELNSCNRELTARSSCYSRTPCRDTTIEDQAREPETDKMCQLTEWSAWSGCSVACGRGVHHRFRDVVNKRYWKKCMSSSNPPILRQDGECIGENGEVCPSPEDNVEVAAALSADCDVSMWSEWSACSVTCGEGIRTRTRELVALPWQTVSKKEMEVRCSHVKREEKIACQADIPSCQLTREQARYDFDSTPGLFGDIKPASHVISGYHHDYYHGTDGPVLDCKVSQWSSWSHCSVTCGKGVRQKTRYIMTNARNGGKMCPKKLLRRRKCDEGPCSSGIGRDYEDVSDYEDDSSARRDDCIYSEWTPWSLCSSTCGLNSVQQRTRSIDHLRTPNTAICRDRLETRVCNVPPCKKY